MLAIKADGLCCYYCAGAIGSLICDSGALESDWAPCSAIELETSRTQILANLEVWEVQKRLFAASDEEFEGEEVRTRLGEGLAHFRARVLGQTRGQERWGSNADLALYTLLSNVLVVVITADLVTPTSSFDKDEAVACSELWFDPLVESVKTRVVCVVLHRNHFQIGVVRTPTVRAIFRRGADWDEARRLILSFIKARPPSRPLGPFWKAHPTSPTTTTTTSTTTTSIAAASGPCSPRRAPQASKRKSMENVKEKCEYGRDSRQTHLTPYNTHTPHTTPYTPHTTHNTHITHHTPHA